MTDDIILRLNELLEAEKAGVETLEWLIQQHSMELIDDLKKIATDEGWSCHGLRQAILQFRGIPSLKKGDFAHKIMALDNIKARLELLAQGQAWVVKRLDILLNMELNTATRNFLIEMRQKHEINIKWCLEKVAEFEKHN